jgi:hypothetical protein
VSSLQGSQPLNLCDRFVLWNHQVIREWGGAGFTHQMQVWLKGKIDVAALKAVLVQLHRRYPVLTARLEEGRRGACWRFRPGAEVSLHESSLSSAREEDVLAHAAEILSLPLDLTQVDPVRFQVVHLPDGRDLFLVQYAHPVMDVGGVNLLLQEIETLWTGQEPGSPTTEPDALQAHLNRFSIWQRLRSVWRMLRVLRSLRGSRTVYLCDSSEPVPGGTLGVGLRVLDEGQTEEVMAESARLSGFPSPTTLLLASTFRALGKHSPKGTEGRSHLVAFHGLSLRPRGGGGAIFANLVTLIPLIASLEEARSRDSLVGFLNQQIRQRIRQTVDLAVLVLWQARSRWGSWRARRARARFHDQSLNFAYVGNLVSRGATFCGVPVERRLPLVQSISPPALSLSCSLSCGRLHLAATYIKETVSDSRAEAFLDSLVKELACS